MRLFKNKLVENIIALSTVKGLDYLLAFITFPYLVRVLQVERYGLICFAQGIIQYFILFTDYGFNLVGPREIATHDCPEERGKVFAGIFWGKMFLLVIAVLVFGLGIFIFRQFFPLDIALYCLTFTAVVGNVVSPIWFFQGVQQMRYITFANIFARIIVVACLFYFVRESADYLWAALLQSLGPLLAGLYSWIVLRKHFPEVFHLPALIEVKQALAGAWTVFASNIAINLYTASNIVFLGLMTNNTVVGYFSGAKKIIDNVMQLYGPVTQAIYPYVSKKGAESRENAIAFLRRVTVALGGASLLLSIFIFFAAPWIVRILLGTGYGPSVLLLRIISFLPFIIGLSNIFGIQTMLNFGMQREFSRVIIAAAVLNTALVLPLILFYQAVGTCVAITVTEIFVTVTMWWVLRSRGIILLGGK